MTKVANENYIVVQGWMVNELNLKGNALLIYAVIYGFSQGENQTFNGSLQYLADWCGVSKRTVITVLKSLCDENLIIKKEKLENNVKVCEYWCNNFTSGEKISLGVVKKIHGGGEKISLGVVKKFHGGGEKISPNNIYNNINNNILDNKERIYKKETKTYDEVLQAISNPELQNALKEFIKMRKLIKKPLTSNALELAIKKLNKMAYNDDDKIKIVNNSVMNSWQSFYPLREEEKKNSFEGLKLSAHEF